MSKTGSARTAASGVGVVLVVMAATWALLGAPASAHHRPDHSQGPPTPSASPTPSPSPTSGPLPSAPPAPAVVEKAVEATGVTQCGSPYTIGPVSGWNTSWWSCVDGYVYPLIEEILPGELRMRQVPAGV